jgi:uncharacterized alpha-E superfamily protein
MNKPAKGGLFYHSKSQPMLARISSNLYRTGRLLERAEHLASYARVRYLAAMDTPYPEQKSALWDSLLLDPEARKGYYASQAQAEEEKLLYFISLENTNPSSIRACVNQARELAREARDSLSADLWEYINRFYHALQDYTAENLQQEGFWAFAQTVEKYAHTIRGYLFSAMLRSEEWKLLQLGYKLERAIQINYLLLNTLRELEGAVGSQQPEEQAAYSMRSLLEGLGSYEMYKYCYQAPLNRHHFLDFLVFHPDFPKSIAHNLQGIRKLKPYAAGQDPYGEEHLRDISFPKALLSEERFPEGRFPEGRFPEERFPEGIEALLTSLAATRSRSDAEGGTVAFLENIQQQLERLVRAFEDQHMIC